MPIVFCQTLIILIICIIQQAKFYVIATYYPILFAGGAILTEKLTARFKLNLIRIIYTLLIIISSLIILPIVRPILPIDMLINYMSLLNRLDFITQTKTERLKLGILPQFFADRFGWEEMTSQVAKIYYSLPKKERQNTFIATQNYGEASAIYFFGKKYKLPMSVSQLLQYFVWGYGKASQSSTVITVGYGIDRLKDLRQTFNEVKQAGKTYNKYAMPFENQPIYL